MDTIEFEKNPTLGGVVSAVKPFSMLTKNMQIPTYEYIVGDYTDAATPGLAGKKYSKLCGFTFTSSYPKAPTQQFQIVYVPKLRNNYTRNQTALSGWYCWMIISGMLDKSVVSLNDMMRKYHFDATLFFHSDLFEKWLPIFKQNIAYALAHQVKELVEQFTETNDERLNELVRYVNAVADSLNKIDEVKNIVMTDVQKDIAPTYARGAMPTKGQAKIAYNANKTYGLPDLDKRIRKDANENT